MLQFARRHDARVHSYSAVLCQPDDVVIEARANEELCAVLQRCLGLRCSQHRPGACHDLGDLGRNRLQALQRAVRAKHNFDDMQSTGGERA